jgi:hypothetical protein
LAILIGYTIFKKNCISISLMRKKVRIHLFYIDIENKKIEYELYVKRKRKFIYLVFIVINMQNKSIVLLIVLALVAIMNIILLNDVSARLSAAHKYALGYQMGCTDGPDQENYVGTGGLHGHSHEFTKGYNKSFSHGCEHNDPALQREVDAIIARHSHV